MSPKKAKKTRRTRQAKQTGLTGPARQTKQEQARIAIQGWLKRGRYGRGEKLPTIMEIAAELGIKSQPVRQAIRLLAGQGLVHTINGRGVFVGPVRSERGPIMVLAPRPGPDCRTETRLGWFVNAEVQRGVSLGIMDARAGEIPGFMDDRHAGVAAVLRGFRSGNCRGLISFGGSHGKLLDALAAGIGAHRIVSAAYSEVPANCNEVKLRFEPGIHAVLEQALSLGHRSIAFLYGQNTSTNWSHLERFRIVTSFLRANGTGVAPFNLVATGGTAMHGYRAAREIFARDPGVSLVVAVTDDRAQGVLQAIEDSGRKPGREVSVIGFDDMPGADEMGLATVRVPRVRIGREAVKLLLRTIRGRLTGERVWVETEAVLRDSLGRAPA